MSKVFRFVCLLVLLPMLWGALLSLVSLALFNTIVVAWVIAIPTCFLWGAHVSEKGWA